MQNPTPLSLPDGVDIASINGYLDDGILPVQIPLPKSDAASQEIAIGLKKDTPEPDDKA